MNSAWVKTEIANAREKTHPSKGGLGGAPDREKKQMLFPITLAPFADVQQWKLFDADRGIDSAREIRVASESVSPSGENLKGLMLPRAIRAGLRGAICGVLGTSGPWLISVV